MEWAKSLPHHHDCTIKLLLGAPLPNSSLFLPERKETYIGESLAAGRIHPSSSPMAANFLFVKKKKGDLRQLNNFMVKNKHPLLLLNSIFEPLAGATIFSKLDVRSAYARVMNGRRHGGHKGVEALVGGSRTTGLGFDRSPESSPHQGNTKAKWPPGSLGRIHRWAEPISQVPRTARLTLHHECIKLRRQSGQPSRSCLRPGRLGQSL